MAGYKQILFDLEPVALYSFDGEAVKSDKRFYVRPEIIDDTGNSNGRLGLETDNEEYPCYHTSNSLSPLDRYEQRAIRFAPKGPQLNAQAAGLSRWPKAYMIAPNCLAWNFSRNEFTYIFLAKRSSDIEHDLQDQKYGHFSYMDVLFEHDGIISLGCNKHWNSPSAWWVIIPAISSTPITVTGDLIEPGITKPATMIVVRFRRNRLEVIRDGVTVLDRTFVIDESSFSLDRGSKQLTIGGCDVPKNPSYRTSDRIVVPTDIDQFAVYNKYIDDTDIARLYRRIWSYSDMIVNNEPIEFWEMDEQQLSRSNEIVGRGQTHLYVEGGRDSALMRQQGPLAHSYGIKFTNTTVRTYYNSFGNYKLLPMSGNFTFMFSFRMEHTNRGVLFTQSSESGNYEGVTIWANSLNKVHNQGNLEIAFNNTMRPLTIASNLSSDWHSVVIRKTGDFFDVWVDGRQQLYNHEQRFNNNSNNIGSVFFGSHLDIKTIDGSLSNIIVFNQALPTLKIRAFNDYESIYKIRGSVALNGNPAKLDIRVYDHDSGALVSSTKSNVETGVWLVNLLDNSAVDILVLDHDDPSVKLKCYGPIIPSEIDDQPYLLP